MNAIYIYLMVEDDKIWKNSKSHNYEIGSSRGQNYMEDCNLWDVDREAKKIIWKPKKKKKKKSNGSSRRKWWLFKDSRFLETINLYLMLVQLNTRSWTF